MLANSPLPLGPFEENIASVISTDPDCVMFINFAGSQRMPVVPPAWDKNGPSFGIDTKDRAVGLQLTVKSQRKRFETPDMLMSKVKVSSGCVSGTVEGKMDRAAVEPV